MGVRGAAMELFLKLFCDLLVFVYHCFDRIVIRGYLSGLSRPEQVVHFFRGVVGVPVISKEVLSQRTADYQAPRSLFCSSSFTSGYADLSPTAASTINPMPSTDPTAVSKLPTIVPTRRSKKSSICSPPLDAAAPSVGVVLSNILRARI
jgi:hypothetical protein